MVFELCECFLVVYCVLISCLHINAYYAVNKHMKFVTCAMQMHSEKILLVTADDFGYDCDRNRGILECFQKCAITRASVLVNGVACSEAFALADSYNIPLGEHLTYLILAHRTSA